MAGFPKMVFLTFVLYKYIRNAHTRTRTYIKIKNALRSQELKQKPQKHFENYKDYTVYEFDWFSGLRGLERIILLRRACKQASSAP